MISTTRRSFLGLLAHLPLVGALFADTPPTVATPDDLRAQQFTDEALHKAKAEVRFIRWMPVTERLPELGDFCLQRPILVAGGESVYVLSLTEEGVKTLRGASEFAGWTHWAELPQPPTEVPA